MFFHQPHNSVGGDIYNAFYYRNINWNSHLHKSYEIAFVIEGKIKLTSDKQEHTVSAGESVILFPYQLHSYSSLGESLVFIVVFSGGYISSFDRLCSEKEAVSSVFTFSDTTFKYASKGLFTIEPTSADATEVPRPPLLTTKACLYALVSEFYQEVTFAEKKRNDSLIYEIISFVENNFTKDITLKSMAQEIGYDYRYLSRVFNETMKVGFKTFVNQYRCEMVKSLLNSSSLSLSEIALNSGFQSIRSFNRVFKQITGSAPSTINKGDFYD